MNRALGVLNKSALDTSTANMRSTHFDSNEVAKIHRHTKKGF